MHTHRVGASSFLAYGIKSIPTLMIFHRGKAINSITGMVPQGVLEDAIKKALVGDAMPAPFIVN